MVPEPWWTIKIFLAVTSHPTIASWTLVRGVAQLGSVSEWGSEGRRFESCRPDNKLRLVIRPAFFTFIGHVSKSGVERLAEWYSRRTSLHPVPRSSWTPYAWVSSLDLQLVATLDAHVDANSNL